MYWKGKHSEHGRIIALVTGIELNKTKTDRGNGLDMTRTGEGKVKGKGKGFQICLN